MNILLVEDDAASRSSLSEFISQMGHQVFETSNGIEAFESLQRMDCQAVLADVRMPQLDGYGLLKKIKNCANLKDMIVVMITGHGDIRGAVEAMKNGAYEYLKKPVDVKELAVIIERIDDYIKLKQEHHLLKECFQIELDNATRKMNEEISDLRKALAREAGTADIGIYSEKLAGVFNTARKLHQRRNIPVLIEGATGTGKEVIARYIHFGDGEVTTPFIAVNCAALTPSLFESELFGYEPGAFTGGNPKGQKGKLELAQNGTLLLDEITELPPNLQAKLLRVLQENEFYRIGGVSKLRMDARIIGTTNQNVEDYLSRGLFREDLYYRLCTGYIKVPSLAERRDEILPLAEMFLQRLKSQNQTRFKGISSQARKILLEHSWPGNVRELKNTIERLSFLWDAELIKPEHLNFLQNSRASRETSSLAPNILSIGNFELPGDRFDLNGFICEVTKKALEKSGGNKSQAARFLGITRRVLRTNIKHLQETE